jgi:hypothetical protein
MRTVLFSICIILFALSSLGQTANKTISGQIKDIQNELVAGAVIKLQQMKDSTTIKTTITKDNGRFIFANLADNDFILTVTSVGTKKYISNQLTIDDNHPAIALPVIILVPDKQAELKEVIVTSKKPLIEQDIDKTIVNVEAMISSSTSNALEVLRKTPGITVENNGDISLNGVPGVLVLIEGRPTYMSATDLIGYLRSIPGSTLDKIELMNNPPAKYDAAGNAVINIRFKRNRTEGYTGSVSLSFSQGITHSSYNSVNLNYLNKKINFFGTINRNIDRNFDDDAYDRLFYDSSNVKISSTHLHNYYAYNLRDFTGRLGMDYTLSSKTTIGFIGSFYGRNRTDNMDAYNNSFFYDNIIPDSSGYGNTKGNSQWKQATANINLLHKFNTHGKELSADINYIHYNNKSGRLLNNYIYANDGSIDSSYTFQYYFPSGINIYNFKTDYTHPLKNKTILSAGMKSSFVKNDNASDYADIINDTHKPDLSKSNHFIYIENINAFYINARKDWQRLGAQLGLRMENSNTSGHQLGNDIVPDSINRNHYTDIFPSLFMSYKLDSIGKHTLSLSFSRRVNRPNYQQLNPFFVFIDQYTYSAGNPYLDPSYNNNLELSYRYKQLLSISYQYNGINDAFFNATQVVNNLFITRPENATTRYMMAILVNLNFPVAKWWRLNINLGGANFVTRGTLYGQSLDQSMYAYRCNLLSQFNFPKDWSAEISSRYTSSVLNLQRVYSPRYQVNAGIQKKDIVG